MTLEPSGLEPHSTRHLLIWRIRLIMLFCVVGGVFFGSKDLLLQRPTPQFWTQIVGTTLASITFFVLR